MILIFCSDICDIFVDISNDIDHDNNINDIDIESVIKIKIIQ